MPHVGNSSTEDLASSDEIKVFKDEGEDEKRASADLTDLKSSLITEGDQVRPMNFDHLVAASEFKISHNISNQFPNAIFCCRMPSLRVFHNTELSYKSILL